MVAFFLETPALAVEDFVEDKKPDAIKKQDGWDLLLTPGMSLSFSDNRNVVGQLDGATYTVGISVLAGADYRNGKHQVRSRLSITEAFSRTPVLDRFIKSTDLFKFEGLYLFEFNEWLGPYGRLNMDTFLLESFDIRPARTTWRITQDGQTTAHDGFELRLTDGLSPMKLTESLGLFARPKSSRKMNVEFRAGFGALHVLADDQLAIKDDDATTDVIEVIGLDGFSQAGGEVGLALWGELYEKKVTYRISADVMMPFINDDESSSLMDLTNVEISANLSFKLLDWLSLDYLFRAVRTPQLIEGYQIQNNLLLTASYSFFKPQEDKK
jgi:hypothetical protein